jgi:hypothetical protein
VHKIGQDDSGKIYLFMRGYSKKAQNGFDALLLLTAYQPFHCLKEGFDQVVTRMIVLAVSPGFT